MTQDDTRRAPSGREWWVPAHGAEDTHEVSSLGRVRTWIKGSRYGRKCLSEPRIIAHHMSKDGYPRVSITTKTGRRTVTVHRLMGESFFRIPPGMEVCHNNGVKTDCRLENLRWDTKSSNRRDSELHGTAADQKGEANGNSKLTADQVRTIRKLNWPTYLIAQHFGVGWQTIDDIKKGRKWKNV